MSENKQLNFDIEKYRQARLASYLRETGGRPGPLDGEFRRTGCCDIIDITKLAIIIFLLLLWSILMYIGAQKTERLAVS